MGYLLGIDFGGGASKATLLCENGDVVAVHVVEYPTRHPKKGWSEQNPEDWISAIKENIRAVISLSNISVNDIKAVALDAATHVAVLLDEKYRLLRPSIYWTDVRSKKEVDFLCEKYGQIIMDKTLHKPDTIWTLPQLLWIRKNEPKIWKQCKYILFAKDYVRYRMTGNIGTDRIEAQGSMFFDINSGKWSEELCDIVSLKENMLPKLYEPLDIVGEITANVALETGLARGTLVICGTTDTAMEILAAGAVSKKDVTIKLATAGRICVITGRAYPNAQLINYSHIINGLWYPGTATKSAAASYRWYRDNFGGDYKSLDIEASSIKPCCNGLMFHPYLTGELTPYGDPLLCGSFTGIRAEHTKAHFNRAVLEGVAFSLLDCKHELKRAGIIHKNEAIIIGGGASSKLWKQIVADVLEMKLYQYEISDSSFGAAMLAGVAIGVFKDFKSALNSCIKLADVTKPNVDNTAKYLEKYKDYCKIHDALAPIYHSMR